MSSTGPSHADDAQRYRLDSRIATGGMGEVWRATDTMLGREVAVKLLKTEYADDPVFRTRFETEARNAAALHHPGVAGVFDVGQATATDGSGHPRPYLVMELVEGEPLSTLLADARERGDELDPVAVRDLMAQTAEALGAAHRAGIVHRDVKPANLMVTPAGVVKVTDFGIARAADSAAITRTGAVMGTPQYLSPEQAEGKPATAASDVYALGVVAFECLAGRRPFEADSPVATALAHLREPVPELPDRVPSDLAGVVTRALAKDPAQRYDDGAAFAAALRDPATAAIGLPAVAPVPQAPATPADPATQVLPTAAAAAVPPVTTTTTTYDDPPPAERAGARSGSSAAWPIGIAVVLLVALAIVVTLLVTGGDDGDEPLAQDTPSASDSPSDQPSSEPTQDESSSQPPETSETTEPEPTTVEVEPDRYVGQPVDQVVSQLESLGLTAVSRDEVDNDGTHDEGAVESVDPSGTVEQDTPVTVSYYGAPAAPPSDDSSSGAGLPTPDDDSPGNSGDAPGQNRLLDDGAELRPGRGRG